MPRSDGLCRVAETPTNCARPASPRLPPRINRDAREILHAKAFADRMPDTSERDGRERVPKITLPHRFKWPRGETYFLRCRILERMRRFLRPNFRRPFPDFFVPTQSSWGFANQNGPRSQISSRLSSSHNLLMVTILGVARQAEARQDEPLLAFLRFYPLTATGYPVECGLPAERAFPPSE